VTHLFALFLLLGLGVGVMIPAINAIIRRVTHDEHLGRAYGAATSLTFIGYILGPLAGGYLAARMGNRAPFILMGVAYALGALVVKWRVRDEARTS
jgi:DHA1 family multidrug resistance protein-like MFS transporter